MKLTNVREIEAFREIILNSKGCVWAQDSNGRWYDLKSGMQLYEAIAAMIRDDLELYASNLMDEGRLGLFILNQRQPGAA